MAFSLITCSTRPTVVWKDLPDSLALRPAEIVLVRIPISDLESVVSNLFSLLQPDELIRASRFLQEKDRLRFGITRAITRLLLSRIVNQRPSQIQFITSGAYTKPRLGNSSDVRFNVSHSGNWAVIAIARDSEVGVDVEQIKPELAFQDIVPETFSTAERHWIETTSNARERFFVLWTRKEALLKAMGIGIHEAIPLLPVLDGSHRTESALSGLHGDWRVESFTLAVNYPATVAYTLVPALPQLHFFQIDSRNLRQLMINNDL
ncbi:4'-phosphopantetheinyl transferase superfamily protein [Spirosoma taeanense]|uniref:4'-phosphopantetheinyl transferase superfamily protein n=1 Tax=Spirosoma taeanense TaxID=2735870 RepID=A0A6M5XZM3_9BACT|nr:4'-phosphopantetheinyl transferase superfamily protein [Spirosoma taeanense]QJW88008.1 4'-phosphopantetheinyl transferase superfamily protein [Spirosoma taeanense]